MILLRKHTNYFNHTKIQQRNLALVETAAQNS